MERILILGCAGAGKTSLAREMGTILGLPVIHLDRHYWRPGWIEPDQLSWAEQVKDLVQKQTWIMDGNYGGTLPLRLAAADTVIYLDFPTWLCMARVLRRTMKQFGRTRGNDMTPGCPERFDWMFIQYVWRYRREHRPRVTSAMTAFTGRLVILSGIAELAAFVGQLQSREHHLVAS